MLSSDSLLPRAQLLLSQKRPALAAAELRRHLAAEPNDAAAHALLGLSLLRLEQPDEARQHVETALGLAPEFDYAYYLLSLVHDAQHRPDEAQQAIEFALALDPTDADYHHVLGLLRFNRGQWQGALAAAEQGLQFDPGHADCQALRGRALARLGRRADAGAALHRALGHDPDSPRLHADAGYVALEASRPAEAQAYFREALRRDPSSDYAREGLVEALKARFWVYRTFMRFAYWSSSLSDGARRGMFIGLFLLSRFLPPLLIPYLALVYMSWFSDSIFTSLLRFTADGRLALSPEQTRHSNHFLALLGGGLGALAAFHTALPLPAVQTLGFVALGLLFPLVGTWRLKDLPQLARSYWAGAGLAAVGLGAIGLELLGLEPWAGWAFSAFLIGSVAYVWIFALS